MQVSDHAYTFAKAIRERSGHAYIVGGSVRDMLLGNKSNDYDWEVFGMNLDSVVEILKAVCDEMHIQNYSINLVGSSFGILKVKIHNQSWDIGIPRRDNTIGVGHKDFAVEFNPFMTIEDAAKRRDFTINSIYFDPVSSQYVDPFNGIEDLSKKILRVVNEKTFVEDPLRALRAVQFIARFELRAEERTKALISSMRTLLPSLSAERIGEEWKKLLCTSSKPSLGLQFGMETKLWEILYPLFDQMRATPQEPEWHPEGDVWTHTLMVVDEASKICHGKTPLGIPTPSETDKEIIMLGALCHDFGKPLVTKTIEGRIRSHGHDVAGVEGARAFVKGMKIWSDSVAEAVGKLTAEHLWPGVQYNGFLKGAIVSDGALRRLARRLQPGKINHLVWVSCADHFGRGPFPIAWRSYHEEYNEEGFVTQYPAGAWLIKMAFSLGIDKEAPRPILLGRDLLNHFPQLKPGPQIGELLVYAEKMHDEHNWTKEQILTELEKIVK